MTKPIPHFVIAGGGTAGWLAALILQDGLKRQNRQARVTVVESSKIPAIGVGEGSTAALRILLQHLGLNEFEFLTETGGTLKLGIRHMDWRRKGFTYDGPIDDPHQVVAKPQGADDDYLNVFCAVAGRRLQDIHLFGALLAANKAPFAEMPDGRLAPLGPFHYAFHFDQAKVGAYLRRKSGGINIVDAMIAGVQRKDENGDIAALILDSGAKLEGDFFIDATGFHRRLIGKELRVPWASYAHELPVNRAMPFWIDIPENEDIPIHTLARAMDAGWMWKIPTQERYGCGYVYCDAFQDAEGAKREIEAALGHEIEARNDIRFETGRLERLWSHNCLAIGLCSAFLEPLEATSIHGTIVQMMLFTARYLADASTMSSTSRDDFNRHTARQIDDFRSFINMHYVTEREDTAFWREMRANRLHSDTQARLDLWSCEMPKVGHFSPFPDGLPHVETQLYYPVLDGLVLLSRQAAARQMAAHPQLRHAARQTADSLRRDYALAAGKAMSHRRFLQLTSGG